MFTSDDYFNITNAHILNENVNHLDEREYKPDEELPSGSTPNKKMDTAQRRHGARYRLSGGGRNNPARDSHFSRGSKIDKISSTIKSGGDPRKATIKSPLDGQEREIDLRKTGRPGVTADDRASRTQRNDDTDAKSTYTQGGLRAHKTKAGGYRTLVKKEEYEYNELLKFLYFEGYADSYKEAECILEDMSDEEFEELNEAWSSKKIERFNKEIKRQEQQRKRTPNSSLRPVDQAALKRMLSREQSPTRSARKPDPTPTEKPKGTRTIKKTELASIVKEDFDIITEFLFVEGYADTIENAELMAESISEQWVDEILDEKYVEKMDTTGRGPDHRTRFPKFKGKDDEFDPKFTQQRVKSNTKKIDPYFSGRKKRKDEKRQGTGGFGA